MRNQLAALTLALLIGAASPTDAQTTNTVDYAKNLVTSAKDFTKETADNKSPLNISSKAIKEFRKKYKSISFETWDRIQDGFMAKFANNEVQYKVYYDFKGNWTGTVRTFSEEQLPKDVRRQVKSVYYDHKINFVQEITLNDHFAYLIYMEDAANWLTIRIVDGEMDVYQELKKM